MKIGLAKAGPWQSTVVALIFLAFGAASADCGGALRRGRLCLDPLLNVNGDGGDRRAVRPAATRRLSTKPLSRRHADRGRPPRRHLDMATSVLAEGKIQVARNKQVRAAGTAC